MAAYEPATVIVGYKDVNESKTEDYIVMNTRSMNSAKALWHDLPVVDFKLGERVWHEGDILFVDWIPVGTDDWVVADSDLMVPITIKNLSTGKYSDAYVELLGRRYGWSTTLVGTGGGRVPVTYRYCCWWFIRGCSSLFRWPGMPKVEGHVFSYIYLCA